MENNSEQYYTGMVLQEIEAIVNRGSSDNWTTYDFEKLSESIFDTTQIRLSVTTLKRIWGKLKYESAPTLTTLNTLAQFAGYADWRAFKQKQEEPVVPAPEPVAVRPKRPFNKLVPGMAGSVLLIVLVFVLFLAARRKQKHYEPGQFSFSANKMQTEGVPNSVVFKYSAGIRPDSLFIVQTWDIRRKTLVSPDEHEHSAIYYYPGFFKSKLIADTQIMKTHDIWITSNGWLCMLQNDPIPIYFKKEQYLHNGVAEVNDSMLLPYRGTTAAKHVLFYNQRDLGELSNDNFVFETKLKNAFDDGTNACHYTDVLIQCKDDIIIIPLAAKSCVGDLKLFFCGTAVTSKHADLSGFGADLTQWTSLRVETVNKTATFYVNNVKAYSLTFPHAPAGIVGVQYRFNGAAAVKETRFTANGKVWEMD